MHGWHVKRGIADLDCSFCQRAIDTMRRIEASGEIHKSEARGSIWHWQGLQAKTTDAFICVGIIAASVLIIIACALVGSHQYRRGVESQRPRIVSLEENNASLAYEKQEARTQVEQWKSRYESVRTTALKIFADQEAALVELQEYIRKDKAWHVWHDKFLKQYKGRLAITEPSDPVQSDPVQQ